jgi:protease II
MSTSSLYLTEHEFDEFDDPRLRMDKIVLTLTNVRKQTYPAIFLVGVLDDKQVPASQAINFGNKIRHYDDISNVLLNIEEKRGHNLNFQCLRVGATEICFISGQYYSWLQTK